MTSINTTELRRNLNDILNRVEFKNQTFTLMRYGKPCAVLTQVDANVIASDPTAGLTAAASPALVTGKSAGKLGKNPK